MDIAIVCQDCHGSGYRVRVYGYVSADDDHAEMLVPRDCEPCNGSGRILTSGWSAG
ncbi:hypothetical protein [Actinorugispora endophytica]|uniref:Molecular chaperone DnaJ n=1 Tax=Actinorugispora endophytica TaxID=1605990 RepID=A0A4R6V8N3_9ACTN|nr:hypothetical protein [Actinorugispora endophytica]TDQ55118.1 hypothetical protein EV190_101441 [Actinorugispora endophytica]